MKRLAILIKATERQIDMNSKIKASLFNGEA